MEYDHDVIIVGAGPTGATVSKILSQNGLDVMVFDKRKELGEPVRCGEGLGAREVVAQDIEIPKHCISTDIVGAKVISPDGSSLTWKDKETTGWVLERKIFDKWLMEQAVKTGARVQSYTRVIDIVNKNGKISGVKVSHGAREPYEVTAPLVISAEGMESSLARKAGFRAVSTLYDVDTCYQYEMQEYDHENLIELYFGNEVAPRGYCLTPDSEIVAKNTIKPITDVKVGEEVLTLEGWKPVTNTCERPYNGRIVRITPFMFNQSVGLTVDHRVFVWNKKAGFHWKKAGELVRSTRGKHRNGDYLVFPLPKEKSINNLLISDYVKDGYIKEKGYLYPKGRNQFGSEFKYKLHHKLKNKLELTPELMEFFGYFVSEGNVSNGAVIISNKAVPTVKRVIKSGEKIFGFRPYLFEQECPNSSGICYQVQFASRILRNLFKSLFGEGCENKRIPHFVHGLDKKAKLALLKGLLNGDGSKWKSSDDKDVVSYVSMSKSLIHDIWMLLAGIGIVGAIKKNKKKNAYEIRIRGEQLEHLGGIFRHYTHGSKGNRGFFLKDNYVILGIRELQKQNYQGKVYDIESSGSFCPFFAVHNCWIFPKKDKKANVGIGIGAHVENGTKEGGIKGADPKILLDKFIEEHPQLKNASKLQDFGGIISVGAPIDSFVKDNFLVVGTAARQVDPIHGGGIALAMEAGVMAANTILKAQKDYTESNLKEYEETWRAGPGKKVAKRLLLRKVMEAASDDDFNHIFKTITDKDLNEIMNGNFAGSVAKVVVGRPQLVGVLKALVS